MSIFETSRVNLDLADFRNYSHLSLSTVGIKHDLLCSISTVEIQAEKLVKILD